MRTLVTDIRQLRKRTPVTTPVLEQIPLSFEAAERSTPLDVALDRLQSLSSALKLLMDALDLELINVSLPPGHSRLWELAGQALEGNRTYTKSEAIERIRLRTSVTQERAEKGFQLMVETNAIESTVDYETGKANPDLYYLGGSTPY